MDRVYAAHIGENQRIHTIKEHLHKTAELAQKFGEVFGSPENAYLCGLLHDIGKYSLKFQTRIYDGGNKVDHSTAGAVEINKLSYPFGLLLAYCVAGHHTGLPDGGSAADTANESTLCGRLKRQPEAYLHFANEITFPVTKPLIPICPLENKGFSISFYIRMLFSCLTDADFLNTEEFMQEKARKIAYQDIETLNNKLDEQLKKYNHPFRDIDKKRSEILKNCIERSVWERGLYTLTVPTGGGKTIASMSFALKHAKQNGLDRVIYVIPYNSIIEQNAAIFKDILGDNNILEHHSGFLYDDTSEDEIPQRLAAENWDMPVIMTTSVQFFESLFANKTSSCRKLHNIANSVIVFDEAQLLPTKYLLPCVRAISELVKNYKCTTLLCSATQPALGKLFPKEFNIKELCDNLNDLFSFFKRTYFIHTGELNDEELAKCLNAQKQVLCIVSTRKQAQSIFNLLDHDGAYHLSTLMYPLHRKRILKEIRERLKNGETCRVISTSLIEAGVDVDFPVVYRAEAGLDSLIQAAGRCNREGKNAPCPVYIFKPEQIHRKNLPDTLLRPLDVTRTIIERFKDIDSQDAIQAFFSELYDAEGEGLDTKHIVERFERGFDERFSFPFAQVGSEFKLIDNASHAVVIPDGPNAAALVQRLKSGERNRQILREIQQYTINIYDFNYTALNGIGALELLDKELAVLADMSLYSKKTGLKADADIGIGIFV